MNDRPTPDRAAAWDLVTSYTESDSLRRHMLAVEAAMRAYASHWDEDVETWGNVGLLHDFDYERFPEEHPESGQPILAEHGWPAEVCRAVLSHAQREDTPRLSRMEKALHACDDVTGLIIACALVRPDKDLRSVKPKSVRKKWKIRAFAAGVDRDEVDRACADLGVDRDEHLETVLAAMQGAAEELGLAG